MWWISARSSRHRNRHNLGKAVATRPMPRRIVRHREYQAHAVDNVKVYMRGVDPTGISDVTLAGMHIPIRMLST